MRNSTNGLDPITLIFVIEVSFRVILNSILYQKE